MDVNKLLDTIQRGLRDVENEILDNLDTKAKSQRTKPVEVRLRELETLVARIKWDVSTIKMSVSNQEMRIEAARNDASQALAEVRRNANAGARRKRE
jgi:2C-methyl-D-erythritol 2,4-cyclodiphosphate synthase